MPALRGDAQAGLLCFITDDEPRKGGIRVFDFERPSIEVVEISDDKKYGRFVVEPLERGYGITLRKLPQKDHAFFSSRCSCKPGQD